MGSDTSFSPSITVSSLKSSLTEHDHPPNTPPIHLTHPILPNTREHTSFAKLTSDHLSPVNYAGIKLNKQERRANTPTFSSSHSKSDKPQGLQHTILLDKHSSFLTLMLINARSIQNKMTQLRALLLLHNPHLF